MIHVSVKGPELVRVLTNVSLWHDPGVSFSKGKVVAEFGTNQISFFSTDGFVSVLDSLKIENEHLSHEVFELDEVDIDRMLLAARDVKTKTLEFTLSEGGIILPYEFEVDEKNKVTLTGPGSRVVGFLTTLPQWVEATALEIYDPGQTPYMMSALAIRPERWLKLSRVRADKDAPIDVLFVDPINPKAPAMAVVKIGGTFRALVNFVDRNVAIAGLGEKAKDYLWMVEDASS